MNEVDFWLLAYVGAIIAAFIVGFTYDGPPKAISKYQEVALGVALLIAIRLHFLLTLPSYTFRQDAMNLAWCVGLVLLNLILGRLIRKGFERLTTP
jgi:hypothetical protein